MGRRGRKGIYLSEIHFVKVLKDQLKNKYIKERGQLNVPPQVSQSVKHWELEAASVHMTGSLQVSGSCGS